MVLGLGLVGTGLYMMYTSEEDQQKKKENCLDLYWCGWCVINRRLHHVLCCEHYYW